MSYTYTYIKYLYHIYINYGKSFYNAYTASALQNQLYVGTLCMYNMLSYESKVSCIGCFKM